VVEDRPMMSVKYCLSVPFFYFWRKLQRTLQRGLSASCFRSIFARSASVVTPSEKSSINTNRKSTTLFPWTQDEHRTLSLSLQGEGGGLKNAKCPKFEQYVAITQKRYEIGCQLVLITNRKSHTGFRLIPTSMTFMTLNVHERHNSPYFAFFHRIRLLCWPITSQWLKREGIRKILSPQFQSSTFGHN